MYGMRRRWGVLLALVLLGSCAQCGSAGQPDGGGGGTGGSGGAGGGDGGGAGGGGGGDVDAGGPKLVGCEVTPQTGGVPPECAPPPGACTSAADCPSDLCLQLGSGSVCTTPCADAGSCNAGWTCQLRWTGAGQQGFCVPERRMP